MFFFIACLGGVARRKKLYLKGRHHPHINLGIISQLIEAHNLPRYKPRCSRDRTAKIMVRMNNTWW
jgi:hypothetical protein